MTLKGQPALSITELFFFYFATTGRGKMGDAYKRTDQFGWFLRSDKMIRTSKFIILEKQ